MARKEANIVTHLCFIILSKVIKYLIDKSPGVSVMVP